MKTKLILDIRKTQYAQLNSMVMGRVGDKASNTVDVYVVDGFVPYNLTGSDVYFECAKPDNTSVRDKNGIVMIDAAKGHFEYTFPAQTFAAIGKSKQAYFTVEKNSTVKATTQDFTIVSIPDALTNRIPSQTYISQLEELIWQLEQIELDLLNSAAYQEAHDAKTFAEQAKSISESVKAQLDQIVIQGSIDPETKQARVDNDGFAYSLLKDRIDGDFRKNKESIDNLKITVDESAINLKKFGAVDGVVSNLAFTNALNSNYDSIIISKGTWKINDTIVANSGTPKKVVGTKGSVISIDLPTNKRGLDIQRNVEFHNITFDFNNKFCNVGLFFREDIGKVTLKNCKFKNIKDTDSTTSSTIVYVTNKGNSVDISGIELENILKVGNGNITDSAGSLNGIYTGNTNVTGSLNGGSISDIKVKEFHNINNAGDIIFEDSASIYLAGLSRADVTIKNVEGYNFGKRLIKTQVSNLIIQNIKGESQENDALSVVGAMDMDNVIISDVQAIGKISVAVNTTCTNSKVSNVYFNIDKSSLAGPNSFGVQVGASDVTLKNISGIAERSIVFKREDGNPFRNIVIDNLNVTIPTYGHQVIQFLPGSEGFEGMTIDNVFVENKSVYATNYVSVFDTFNLNTNNKTSKDLTINNVVLNSKYNAAADNERIMNLYKISGVRLRNIAFTNDLTTRAYRALYIEDCSDVRIKDLDTTNAFINSACQLRGCIDISLHGIKAHPTSSYVSTVFNSTKVKFSECDQSRILVNDSASIQSTTYEKKYSIGPTNLRPTNPVINDEHYDTTLKYPVVWNGTQWVNLIGVQGDNIDWVTISTTVSGRPLRYRRFNGVVTVMGSIANVTNGASFATLISGCRPAYPAVFPVIDATGVKTAELTIDTSGSLVVYNASANATIHMTISFPV